MRMLIWQKPSLCPSTVVKRLGSRIVSIIVLARNFVPAGKKVLPFFHELTSTSYVENVVRKAHKVLGLLRRNLTSDVVQRFNACLHTIASI